MTGSPPSPLRRGEERTVDVMYKDLDIFLSFSLHLLQVPIPELFLYYPFHNPIQPILITCRSRDFFLVGVSSGVRLHPIWLR